MVLINDLLDISKIEARTVDLEQVPFSLSQIMQEVISMMGVRVHEKGLQFTSNCDCVDKRLFIGDPTRLRQVILNLCSNAVKFTEKGAVSVNVSCEPVDAASEKVTIAVADTGIGIPADKLESIFDKFVQADSSINRKYGGTGLGLAITRTLTEIMGGTLAVTSTPGVGSTFTITLTLSKAESRHADDLHHAASQDDKVPGGQKPMILLVEDYPPNVMVAQLFLEEFGYDCEVASNGFEAVEMRRKRDYAAILMDVQMHGMNGLEATRLIREIEKSENRAHTPIIGMTAHALAGDRERCLGVGMDDYIPKPFNPDELKRKIASQINLPAQ